jgi:hypothetical protein
MLRQEHQIMSQIRAYMGTGNRKPNMSKLPQIGLRDNRRFLLEFWETLASARKSSLMPGTGLSLNDCFSIDNYFLRSNTSFHIV